jgi:ribosomal protein S18 acetylase RimI-like enzyme
MAMRLAIRGAVAPAAVPDGPAALVFHTLDAGDAMLLIAIRGDARVGSVMLFLRASWPVERLAAATPAGPPLTPLRRGAALLSSLHVVESERRGGIGTALVSAAMAVAAANGLDEVALHVAPSNHAALALYERLGFTPAGNDGDWLELVRLRPHVRPM